MKTANLLLSLAALSLVQSPAAVAATPAAGEPIVIGGSLDMSGAAADVGRDVLDGAQYAVATVNQNGGVLGRPLVLNYQDNGTNPQKSVDQSTALARNGAKFLLAPQSSASVIAVSKTVSARFKIPTCASSSNSDDITIKQYEPYIFAMAANAYMEIRAITKLLASQPYKRYAIISADYAAGRNNAVRFKKFIKEFNPQAQIVVEEYPKFGATDYTASINKVLAAKPDYVFDFMFGSDLLTFSKQAAALGFFEQVNNHFMSLYDGNTLRALGSHPATGSEGWQRAPVNVLMKGSPQAQAYVKHFKAQTGHLPSDWATLAYDCVSIWAQAANAAKSVESDAVMAAIESREFSSPRGAFRFGKYDHQAIVPTFIGKLAHDKDLDQTVLDITTTISGESSHPDEATVMSLRREN